MSKTVGLSTTLQPDFIATPSGRLFTLLHQPADARTSDIIVLLPPFGEEMNKSRHQITVAARTWSALGFPVLVFDLYGTGDSEGAFAGASVTLWHENINDILGWLASRGFTSVTLWALRFGALFVPGVLQTAALPVSRTVLWQPVTSGKLAMNQFLRLQTAANMLGQKNGRTVAELQECLAAGHTVEVAGYGISARLYAEALELQLSPNVAASTVLDWLQIQSGPQAVMPPAATRAIDLWRNAGSQVRAQVLADEPFWSTTEITTAPELLTCTTTLLQSGLSGTGASADDR